VAFTNKYRITDDLKGNITKGTAAIPSATLAAAFQNMEFCVSLCLQAKGI
jgi:hypothetical protein